MFSSIFQGVDISPIRDVFKNQKYFSGNHSICFFYYSLLILFPISWLFHSSKDNYQGLCFFISLCMFITILIIDLNKLHPKLSQYLIDIICCKYIKNIFVRLFLLSASFLGALFFFAFFNLLNGYSLILGIPFFMAIFLSLCCLIKARFKLETIKQVFVIPHDAPFADREISDEIVVFQSILPWYQKLKYRPFLILLFYIILVYPMNVGPQTTLKTFLNPVLLMSWTCIFIFMGLIALGKKISFIIAPFVFIFITATLYMTGGGITILEILFFIYLSTCSKKLYTETYF